MGNLRQQLSVEELHLAKWEIGGLLSLLAMWTVFYIESTSGALAVAASLLVIAVMLFPRLPGHLPELARTVAVPVMVTVFAVDLILRNPFLEALIRLSLLLLLYRTINYRKRREDLQLVVLALFLVVVTGVITVSLLFGLQILLFTIASMLFLFVVTLAESAKPEREVAPGEWTVLPVSRLLVRSLRNWDWRHVVFGGSLMLGLMAIASSLFMALPRVQIENQLDFLGVNRMGSSTGFSDRMELNTVTNIREDNSIVMRIEVDDPGVLPDTPYWRMVVMDQYRDGVFRESAALRSAMQSQAQQSNSPGMNLLGVVPRTQFRVYLEEGVGRYLPNTGTFHRIAVGERLDLRLNPFSHVVFIGTKPPRMIGALIDGMDASGRVPEDRSAARLEQMQERGMLVPTDTVFGYSVVPMDIDPTGSGRRFSRYPETTMQVPVGNEDYSLLLGWVDEITGGREMDALEFAKAAVGWLGARHSYSLQSAVHSSLAEDRDIIVRWLDGRGAGHCEYFAAAFALLARTAGHPARVVAGFKGGTWNRQDENRPYIAVRNSEAHAWVEIFDGEGFWHLVEPTPGGQVTITSVNRGSHAANLKQDLGMRAWLDSLRMAWYRRVISFDERSQERMLNQAKQASQAIAKSLRESIEGLMQDIVDWLRGPWDLARVSKVAGVLMATGSLVFLMLVGWSRRLWLFAAVSQRLKMDGVRREAARWLQRLRHLEGEGTVPCEDSQPVRERLERLRWGPPGDRTRAVEDLERCRRDVRLLEKRRR
jgi:hypothetical protein